MISKTLTTILNFLLRQTIITLRLCGHRSMIRTQGTIGVSKGKHIDPINSNLKMGNFVPTQRGNNTESGGDLFFVDGLLSE